MKASKHVDKLVEAFTRDGREQCIYLHIEVQGHKDNNFEKRMFTYFYRIMDRLKKPVTAIVILTDEHKNFRPAIYQYDFLGTSLSYKFNVYKILDQKETDLLANDNPFAVVILTVLLALKNKNLDDKDLLSLKTELARNLLSKNIPPEKIRWLLRFLKYYVRFKDKDNNTVFDSTIQTITNQKEFMGIEEFMIDRAEKEGIEKGIRKGERKKARKVVTFLLLNTDLDITKIAEAAEVPESFVDNIKKRVELKGSLN
jgi:predicted transposase/invertase (TIGR01784 family)